MNYAAAFFGAPTAIPRPSPARAVLSAVTAEITSSWTDANVDPAAGQWLTYGPPLTLSGTGRRNPEIASGSWVGQPQEPKSRCHAEQVPLANPAETAAVATGDPGQPLSVHIPPSLYSITLSGDCLWQRVS